MLAPSTFVGPSGGSTVALLWLAGEGRLLSGRFLMSCSALSLVFELNRAHICWNLHFHSCVGYWMEL